MRNPTIVYLALGSNLGQRQKNLSRALRNIATELDILKYSSIYETPPWGVTEQPRFLNQVIQGTTVLPPHALLDFLKKIERKMGRVETVRFGPRVIDLDILLYGERLVNTPRLQIPHPRMHERAFVLVPLEKIEPTLVIPGQQQTITDLCGLSQFFPCAHAAPHAHHSASPRTPTDANSRSALPPR